MDALRQLTNCTVYSTVTKEDDEQEWLKARTRGIGGSDVGPICNVSPWTSARQIYLNKTGQYADAVKNSDVATQRMHFGSMLEPVVADEFSRRTGLRIVEAKATLVHKDVPWALANVDRLIVDIDGKPIGVLECKTAGEYMNEEWENGDLLLSYLYQLNWYLWITGFEKGYFACLVGGNKFYHYEVFRNDELLTTVIIPTVTKFWEECVCQLKEPEMQSCDTEFANKVYSEVVKNSEIVLDDDVSNELARTVFECKAQIKELTLIMEEAQNRIKDRLKDTEIGYTRDYTVKWSPRSQVRVDTDKLKSWFPDVYKECQKQINFRAMYVKGVK